VRSLSLQGPRRIRVGACENTTSLKTRVDRKKDVATPAVVIRVAPAPPIQRPPSPAIRLPLRGRKTRTRYIIKLNIKFEFNVIIYKKRCITTLHKITPRNRLENIKSG
jgi:hypothetical protein